jgi:maltodextrin utilization protein YvdJ
MGFVNGFLSYLLVLVVFVIAGGAAIFLGITLRKRSNAKAEEAGDTAEAEQAAN